jgi:hypothetical protein
MEIGMNRLAKYVGVGALGTLCCVGVMSGSAWADQKMSCNMKGTWVDRNDDFIFSVDYLSKDGPDTFSGVYVNPSNGAMATVSGSASKGTWVIKFAYTDAKRAGTELELMGQGAKDPKTHEVKINGTFKATKNIQNLAESSRSGRFSMLGQCK